MNVLTTSSPSVATLRTEARLFAREPGSLFWILAFPALLLLVIGFVPPFREADPALGGLRVVDVYSSVAVVLAAIMAAITAMPSVLAVYRETGVLRRLRTTPVHPGVVLGTQVALHAAAVLVSMALALAVGHLVHDVPLPGDVAWYAVTAVLTAAAAFSIGAVVTAIGRTARAVQTLGTVVFFPLMFTAGVWVPVPTMTGWLHDIVVATPLGAAAESLDAALLGRSPDLVDLAVTVGWTAALALVAVRSFRWE